MRNLWDSQVAAGLTDDLAEIVYGSRLVGADPSLVLHGGGNTSIKSTATDIAGREVDVLYVKGSGWDLATIEPAGFAPLRLEPVRQLAELPALADTEMMNQLRINLLDASAPDPSVETILHAIIRHRSVLHSHADSVVALTNTPEGADVAAEVWGDYAVIVPYVMPGFDLASACAEHWAQHANADTKAMVLLNHGIFTFGDDTKAAYDVMVQAIGAAHDHLARQRPRHTIAPQRPDLGAPAPRPEPSEAEAIAQLRSEVSHAASAPMLVSTRFNTDETRQFCRNPQLASLAGRGPATPDHIIRTKQLPLVDGDVDAYTAAYHAYFERNAARHATGGNLDLAMLDPAPRVVLDPQFGMAVAGRRWADCKVAADIYRHTIWVIDAATSLGGYVPLGEADLFDVEYWSLEQAKLKRGTPTPPPLQGQVAVVTGAASGIGLATARAFANLGAAVAGIDLAAAPDGDAETPYGAASVHIEADVTDQAALNGAFAECVATFGGVDALVACAGTFGPSAPLAELSADDLRRTLATNAESVAATLGAAHRYLRLSPVGGRVVLVGSKNVPAPGPGATAYSASKAAAAQVARVAALEWAADGITVNTVHPDAVFDTGLWSDELVASRAAAYGMTAKQYRTRNLLGREVTSATVGELVATMCLPAFACTTGAQVPVDGGSDRTV